MRFGKKTREPFISQRQSEYIRSANKNEIEVALACETGNLSVMCVLYDGNKAVNRGLRRFTTLIENPATPKSAAHSPAVTRKRPQSPDFCSALLVTQHQRGHHFELTGLSSPPIGA